MAVLTGYDRSTGEAAQGARNMHGVAETGQEALDLGGVAHTVDVSAAGYGSI